MTLLAGYQKVEMANLWVLLAICWSFITLIQAQQTPKNSLTATSLNVPLSSARYSLLSSTSSPSASLTKQKSISSKEELVLSGTYYHEALSPIATSSSTLNEIAAVHITATSTLAHLNGTKTAAHPHRPTNTQPCNQHIEFCKRSYGNITNVGTHNSPFVRENNAAANQHLDVTTQLDDGIRMLQGQTHLANGTLYLCHTSCDILNAGPLEDWLKTIVNWLKRNPFEVITILIGNGDFVNIGNYTMPMENSGMADMAYVPSEHNLKYDEWPTLSEIILSGTRAVVFMDYKADESLVPYILDEFSYLFETPFSQTNEAFPCAIDRPPEQPKDDTEGKMFIANHNLNVELDIINKAILIPNTVAINQTNAVSGFGSLGAHAQTCEQNWGRYPNFLLVDFYDSGSGSVFEVAAKANNVTYKRKCCGKRVSGASQLQVTGWYILIVAIAVLVFL